MAERYDLVILGLGSAGIVAAEFAARLGLRVAAVERDRVGGDCLWTGCVPSKALLASARAAHAVRTAQHFGLPALAPEPIDTAAVWARVRSIQQDLATSTDDPQRLVDRGVEVLHGAARLAGPTTVEVDGHGRLETRHVLVATGSRPAVPPIAGLQEAGYLTSETIWDLERAPGSVVALGAGPIALELAQALVRLDVPVTVLEREERVLPREEPVLAARLAALLSAEGMDLELGVTVQRVATTPDGRREVHAHVAGVKRSWVADAVLVGVGRVPNVEGLGLEKLGVRVGPTGVEADASGRTAVRTVWAAGDVAGGPLFTHSAGFEAARAVRSMFFPGRDRSSVVVPWCTFTEPELAHAGMTEAQARAAHGSDKVRVWRQDLVESDRARADGAAQGAVMLVTAGERLVGAHVLAPGAGELIGELTLAIEQGLRLRDLAGVVHVYPTIALAVQQLAAEASYERAERLKWLIRGRA